MGYKHITLKERESIMVDLSHNLSFSQIARNLNRDKSTISREIKRGSLSGEYIAFDANEAYLKRRKKCKADKKLYDNDLCGYIGNKVFNEQWSPEEIVERNKAEVGYFNISVSTIYRGFQDGLFDKILNGYCRLKATKRLRHKGKKRGKRGIMKDKRGTFEIENHIEERPIEAENRTEIGHWEADTIEGKKGGVCLTTLVDRKSRFTICVKTRSKTADEVNKEIIKAFRNGLAYSITPDRGKEFARYKEVTKKLGIPFYFPPAHQPWQRGTNENTNGLLREYFPKKTDIAIYSKKYINDKVKLLNLRPRKCLNWKTPFEVYYGVPLHLV